eukprot:3356568-Pyramimonas_sp.AAC.1
MEVSRAVEAHLEEEQEQQQPHPRPPPASSTPQVPPPSQTPPPGRSLCAPGLQGCLTGLPAHSGLQPY